jgi:hypothetical protein
MKHKGMLILVLLLISTACTPTETATETATAAIVATATATATATEMATATATVMATATATEPATAVPPTPTAASTEANSALPEAAFEEAILIQEPGPGSRLVSPLVVRGEADSTFEQNLVVRLVAEDGTELGQTAVIIAAEMGQRGPFEATLPFTVSGEQQAFIEVFATSPRDGGVTHLNSVGVMLTDGVAEIRPSLPDTTERIVIIQPALAATISGGMVQVSGVGVASFEQTLLVELVGEDGTILASQPVIANASDLGQPGPFSAELPYSVSSNSPGRVVVRDISPANGGDVHVTSVEVTLAP